MKRYNEKGVTGLVEQRKNRLTGMLVSLYHAGQAGLDDADGEEPWSTVCEEHGSIVSHTTLKLARGHLTVPEWCEDCQRAVSEAFKKRGGE